jgi:MoxR-like ATPase
MSSWRTCPGTAKTILARALAQTVEGTAFARIQCTPDLQPTDVTGLSIFNQKSREFEFRAGPVFANVVLVDEVNRAMPRTQSALGSKHADTMNRRHT